MDYHKDTLTNRILMIIIFAGFIIIVTYAIGRVLTFYQTGTEPGDAMNMNPKLMLEHTPDVTWLPQHPRVQENLGVNKFLLKEVASSYLNSWYLANISIKNGEPIALKDYYSKEPRTVLAGLVSDMAPEYQVYRIDLNHTMRMTWMAPDLQICAFEDRGVPIIKRMIDPETQDILSEEHTIMDIDVVMTLEDGNWRIRHMVAQRIEEQDTAYQPPLRETGRITAIDQVKGINYYPAETPWHDFWSNFNDTTLHRDFHVMDSLGFNTARIFIPFEEFGKGNVNLKLVDRLVELLDIAEAHDVDVIVTLFDFLYDFSLNNYSAIDRHIDVIAEAIKDHPALLAWDIKNEPDLDYFHYGQDRVERWLRFVLHRLDEYDPDTYKTIGWLDPTQSPEFHDYVDFVSYHFYEDPTTIFDKMDQVRSTIDGPKSVMIEEFGRPTYNLLIKKSTDEDQAEYYQTVMSAISQMEGVSFALWTLYDFTNVPNQVVGALPWKKIPQKGYGIMKNDTLGKPALEVIRPYLLSPEE